MYLNAPTASTHASFLSFDMTNVSNPDLSFGWMDPTANESISDGMKGDDGKLVQHAGTFEPWDIKWQTDPAARTADSTVLLSGLITADAGSNGSNSVSWLNHRRIDQHVDQLDGGTIRSRRILRMATADHHR